MANFNETMSGPDLRLGGGGSKTGESNAGSVVSGVADLASIGFAYVQQKRRDRFSEELQNAKQQDFSALQENQVAIQQAQQGLPRTNEEFIALGEDTAESREFYKTWKRIDQLKARNSTLATLKQRQLVSEYSTRYPMQTNVWQSQLAKDNGTFDYMREVSEAAPTREERYRAAIQEHAAKNGYSDYRMARILAAEARWKSGLLSQSETAAEELATVDYEVQGAEIAQRTLDLAETGEIAPELVLQHLDEGLHSLYISSRQAIIAGGFTKKTEDSLLKRLDTSQKIHNAQIKESVKWRLDKDETQSKYERDNYIKVRNEEMSSFLHDRNLFVTYDYYQELSEEEKPEFYNDLMLLSLSQATSLKQFHERLTDSKNVLFTREPLGDEKEIFDEEDLSTLRVVLGDVLRNMNKKDSQAIEAFWAGDEKISEEVWTGIQKTSRAILLRDQLRSPNAHLKNQGSQGVIALAQGAGQMVTNGDNVPIEPGYLLFEDMLKIVREPNFQRVVREDKEMQGKITTKLESLSKNTAEQAKMEGFSVVRVDAPFSDEDISNGLGPIGTTAGFIWNALTWPQPSGPTVKAFYTIVGDDDFADFDRDLVKNLKSDPFNAASAATYTVLAGTDAIATALGVKPGFSARLGANTLNIAKNVANSLSTGGYNTPGKKPLFTPKPVKTASPRLRALVKHLNVTAQLAGAYMGVEEIQSKFPLFNGVTFEPEKEESEKVVSLDDLQEGKTNEG